MSTLLREAILAGGQAQAVELALRECGTSACCQVDVATGQFPLHLAARLGQAGTIKRLLRCGAGVDVRTTDGHNATALHFAAGNGHAEAAETLLAAGANVTSRDAAGHTATYLASCTGNTALADHLRDLQLKAGDFELADLPQVAAKQLGDVTQNVKSWLSSLNPFAAPEEKLADANAGGPAAEAVPTPAPPEPLATPGRQQASARAALEKLAATVDAVGSEVEAGHHLRGYLGWQDILTKAACELDTLDVGGDRARRKALIARIDEISDALDARLKASDGILASSGTLVAELEGRLRAGPSQSLDYHYRGKLQQVASSLDSVECATEKQRNERKALLSRIDAVEATLERRGRG